MLTRFFILNFIFLAGCAYPQKTTSFEPAKIEKNEGLVYLYRTPTSIHSINPDVPKFYINDEPIGRLVIGGYYAIKVQPGDVNISYKTPLFGILFLFKNGRIRFQVLPNKPVYVKFAVLFSMGTETVFEVVPDEVGRAEIKETNLLK